VKAVFVQISGASGSIARERLNRIDGLAGSAFDFKKSAAFLPFSHQSKRSD